MSNRRANIFVLAIFFIISLFVAFIEGIWKGILSLLNGKNMSLRVTRFLQIVHWGLVLGPKKFWKRPQAIQIGRVISTCIQVIFYPKK